MIKKVMREQISSIMNEDIIYPTEHFVKDLNSVQKEEKEEVITYLEVLIEELPKYVERAKEQKKILEGAL